MFFSDSWTFVDLTDLSLFEGLILVKNIFLMVIKSFVWLQLQMERFVLALLYLNI